MTLIRTTVILGLLTALTGCSDSLFDATPSLERNNKTPDADNRPLADGGATAAPPKCPTHCEGDAFKDFSFEENGKIKWSYLVDTGDSIGVQFSSMTKRKHQGQDAWLDDKAESGFVKCDTNSTIASCQNVDFALVAIQQKNAKVPVLAFKAPNNGTYRLTGNLRVLNQDKATEIRISRNSRYDTIFSEVIGVTQSNLELNVNVNAIKGDQILLSFRPVTGIDITPVSMQLHVSLVVEGEEEFPGTCQMAYLFNSTQGENQIIDSCQRTTAKSETATVAGDSIGTHLGASRNFQDKASLLISGDISYANDFTLQMWARFPKGFTNSSFDRVAFSDVDGKKGMDWFLPYTINETISPKLRFCGDDFCWNDTNENDGKWHFLRVSRKTDLLLVCIDGVKIGQKNLSPKLDLTPSFIRTVGRTGEHYMQGFMDDLRIFSEALPCK